MKKKYLFSEIVNLTLKEIMKSNKKTVLFGLGADDPKGIFGTTKGLKQIFGSTRVFDMPASENANLEFARSLDSSSDSALILHTSRSMLEI